jgi:hypothetical protein
VGGEVGQLVIVLGVAVALALSGRGRPALAAAVARVGSMGVILAGTYWFVDRLFWTGG